MQKTLEEKTVYRNSTVNYNDNVICYVGCEVVLC